jgi:hypothetical protein
MMRRMLNGFAGLLIAIAVVLAGIGWLYLLRRTGALRVGPRLPEALPLQRLAGGAAQPLGRIVAAWLPAGIAGGVALSLVARFGRPARAALMFVASAGLLLASGALSDAVTASDTVSAHLGAQPGRAAIWIAAALAAAGAALPGALARARR